MRQFWIPWLAWGCTAEPLPAEVVLPADTATVTEVPPPTGEIDSACGALHYVDMTLTGIVVDPWFWGISDAVVRLEERSWSPTTIHGEGRTDSDGRFVFDLQGVPILEECWGIGPQFYVVAETDDGVGEIPANMHLVFAWLDGTLEADITGYPCMVE